MAGEYLEQKSFRRLLTWQQLCVHICTATQGGKAEIKSSCAWIHADNDVNISHSEGDEEAMHEKRMRILLAPLFSCIH